LKESTYQKQRLDVGVGRFAGEELERDEETYADEMPFVGRELLAQEFLEAAPL
jgi:hypothetical protein